MGSLIEECRLKPKLINGGNFDHTPLIDNTGEFNVIVFIERYENPPLLLFGKQRNGIFEEMGPLMDECRRIGQSLSRKSPLAKLHRFLRTL